MEATVARLLLKKPRRDIHVWQHGHTLPCPHALYSVCQSVWRDQLRHINGYIRDQICAQVGFKRFNKALILLRERMGSKKLLLKQREAAEAFASGRVSVFRPATVRSFATVAYFSRHRWCWEGFSELQIWVELSHRGWSPSKTVPPDRISAVDGSTLDMVFSKCLGWQVGGAERMKLSMQLVLDLVFKVSQTMAVSVFVYVWS